jgi:hypothetical protein
MFFFTTDSQTYSVYRNWICFIFSHHAPSTLERGCRDEVLYFPIAVLNPSTNLITDGSAISSNGFG